MVFSSTIFLFLFLPLVLGVHFVIQPRFRNTWLLLSSLGYYAWGESSFLHFLLGSVLLNYSFGLAVERLRGEAARKAVIALAVVLNLGLLLWFKYAAFAVSSFNDLRAMAHWGGAPLSVPAITLPLGISFLTFHALSYVVDVYRRQAAAQKNLALLCLYILFFPQLIAGPIVRYHEISEQLTRRRVDLEGFTAGVERFIVGLGKKMLIANTAGEVADGVFGVPSGELTTSLAWLGAFAYALQVYFDFSGYSDMAVGLARVFGFRFPENFDYPYIARSMTEFWRRWHMSLSRFFRDYLYVPLGGNRRGSLRTYANLATVFVLCGLWHGAHWSFVVWGACHGAFLILERVGLLRLLERTWAPLRHAYCLLVILGTWVYFRAPDLPAAHAMLGAMVGRGHGSGVIYRAVTYLDHERILALAVGVVAATPISSWLAARLRQGRLAGTPMLELSKLTALCLLALASAMRLSAGTYNPFIYFRF